MTATGVEAASSAWASLSGLPALRDLHVFVDAGSPLGPAGWIAILTIGSTVTASVPRADLVVALTAALTGLTADEATNPEAVLPRMPPVRNILGPAQLYYPGPGFTVSSEPADEASEHELVALAEAVAEDELDESGVHHVESPVFVSRSSTGTVAAAAGYRRWSNEVAHLSVLAHPDHRGRGHGGRAAGLAIRAALDERLLPQWRARPLVSQRAALAVGFVRAGAQLSLEPD